MKKYIQILAVLIVFALLVIAKQGLSSDEGERRRVEAPIPTTIPGPTTPPVPTTKPVLQVGYRDGTYTGNVADAYYGYIQVQAIVSGGKLSDVKFLQYPNDNRTSISINTQAMPYLRQEAIQAQSAKVNTVSGASDSSAAFRESLQVALKQAS